MSRFPEEWRAAKLELRDVELSTNKRQLSGIAVPYNVAADIGWFTETHLPGSLAKSIKESARGLALHAFHDDMTGQGEASSWPIGVASEWKDDGDALRGVWDLDDDPKAQRAAKLAEPDENGNSKLGYLSIRFAPIRSNWTMTNDFNPDLGPEHKDHVDRVESRLVTVGLVTAPAFASAAVEWVRSAPPPGREIGERQVSAWQSWLDEVKAGPR
jgi:phage head maturation protease